jgi:predicted phosphodiesterase
MKKVWKFSLVAFISLLVAVFIFLLVDASGTFYWSNATRVDPKVSEAKSNHTKVLNLAIISDVHNSWDNLDNAIQIINNTYFDMVIFLGDLTDTGEPENLQKGKIELEKLRYPVFAIPGNHDIWNARQDNLAPDYYFDQDFSLQTCSEHKGFEFVFIDNSDEQEGLTPNNWNTVMNCLNKPKPLVVFSHEPLYHPTNDFVMGKYDDGVATQAAKLMNTLCQKKAKVAVSGHQHSFSQYFYDCPNGYKLPMIVDGALTKTRNFQPARFLKLSIFNDGGFEDKEEVLK